MRNLLAITAIAAAAFSVSASAATIDLSSLTLAGTAAQVGNGVQLTNFNGPNYQSGAAWLAQGVSTTTSFSTSFSFSLKGDDSGKMADGIALVFQNIGSNVTGNAGGDVGYWNLGGHSGSAAVGSVIRSWDNNEYGISTDGVVQGLNKASWNFGALNDVTGTQTITYNATTHVLSMTGSFSDGLGHTLNVSDSDTVDLSAKFGSTMYVGFTGATGGADADQRITGFSVSAVPEPETYAMLMAGLGLVGFAARRRKAA
jgi:hypothetical protein